MAAFYPGGDCDEEDVQHVLQMMHTTSSSSIVIAPQKTTPKLPLRALPDVTV